VTQLRWLDDHVAMPRLSWVLAGLEGSPGWGEDAAEVIAPAFVPAVPPPHVVGCVRKMAETCAPVELMEVEVRDRLTLRARVKDREAGIRVVGCTVEPDPPHRLAELRASSLVPAFARPPLPMDFDGYPLAPAADGARLVVFAGLPGSGKSTLADAAGRRLGVPVFACDWLLGSLTSFGGYHLDRQLGIAGEMLTTLAVRQLSLGQSAILDWPAEEPELRTRLRSLARATGADFNVVLCVCSDRDVHRTRLEGRTRDIPGWHQGGNWANVERRLAAFPPWQDDHILTVDTVQSLEACLAAVLGYLGGTTAPA
jgi:hypothetical protein